MNVVLVNPPNHRFDIEDLAPPLGLLMIAQTLIELGADTALLDLNLESCRRTLPPAGEFYRSVCARILELCPDVVCFTSMGINSHVALELARHLKRKKPSLVTVFGGPHFASIATELKEQFAWVDYVISGAGESSVGRLIRSLDRGSRPESVLTNQEGDFPRLLRHPWNAYSTIDLEEYFTTNPRRVLDFETGRGCKFKCSFCYSPKHWSERFDFELSQVIEDVATASTVGAKHLFLVQDNLLNDRLSASALCLNLAELSPKPSWNCYGTLRDIDDEMSEYLARGGCVGIYIGIDAVTSLQKRQFGKSSFARESECLEKVRTLVANSITPTCAFILDPLNWSEEELEATFRLALTLRLSGSELSLHFLTAYNNTGLTRRMVSPSALLPDDYRVRLMFDCPEVVLHNPLVSHYPSLFPFHTRRITGERQHQRAVACVFLAQHLLMNYPYELNDLLSFGQRRIGAIINELYDRLPTISCPEPETFKACVEESFEHLLADVYHFTPVGSK